jgi:sec-independent protein translocase protein TatA
VIEFLEKPGVVIVLLVALVVFGSKRLPDSARALGRSLRILKAEAKGLRDDDAPASSTQVTQLPAAPAVPPAAPVPPAPVAPEQQAVAPQGQPPQT